MISMFFWAAFGAVIGWVAAILQNETALRRIAIYIVLGAIGGLIGGFGGLLLSPPDNNYRSSTSDIMFAVFGASLFAVFAGIAAQNRSDE